MKWPDNGSRVSSFLLDFQGDLRRSKPSVQRVATYPDLTGSRLLSEICQQGYEGGYSVTIDFPREVR